MEMGDGQHGLEIFPEWGALVSSLLCIPLHSFLIGRLN